MPSELGYIPSARTGTYPVRAGNFVRPLVDGVPAFRRICEVVEAAERSVWVTVAFIERFLVLPDGRGTFFDLLDRAVARGLDVRVVFWREPDLDPSPGPGWDIFAGNAVERAWLAERGSTFRARWDHLPKGCHHQKSWIVDAGGPGEVAFVGGINLDRMSMVEPGHRAPEPREHYHDVHLELAGPCASDVHHNFVQRWNEASERGRADGVWPPGETTDLAFPSTVSVARGDSVAQVVRTVRDRERSVLESYVGAIDAAQEWIYVENQFFFSHTIFERLDAALRRGVEVVVVVPGRPAGRSLRGADAASADVRRAGSAGAARTVHARRIGGHGRRRDAAGRLRAREDRDRRWRVDDGRVGESGEAELGERHRAQRRVLGRGNRGDAIARSLRGAPRRTRTRRNRDDRRLARRRRCERRRGGSRRRLARAPAADRSRAVRHLTAPPHGHPFASRARS
jgi:phosphatidylserine/phosphatidylglycerophosphate/cardiolipin synthase-like enzyme